VLIRWEVTILRSAICQAWIANPVYGLVAGREIEPAKDFVKQITEASKEK
jgi:hypothetical protein